jgi:hypothetical protein
VQDVVRFTNNIEDNNRYFPRGGPGNRGGEGTARSAARCGCCAPASACCLTGHLHAANRSPSCLHNLTRQLICLAGELDLCGNRLYRYQQRNSTGKVDEVKTAGKGRATVIHFHGEASVPSMDGWAEQYFCQGETKVWIAA